MSKTCALLKGSMLLSKLQTWHRAQVAQVHTRLNQNLLHCQTRMTTHHIDTLRATWAKQLIERIPVMAADAAALARKLDDLEAQMQHHIAAAAVSVVGAVDAAVNAVETATEPAEPVVESAEPAAVQPKPKRVRAPRKKSVATQSEN